MKPIDYRNETFENLKERLTGLRMQVHLALKACREPVTTRQLAEISGIDLLNVRPRVTDLVDLGLAECVGEKGTEGKYVSVADHTARYNFHLRKKAALEPQLELF